MAKRTKKDKRRVLLGLLVISIMLSYLSVFVYNYWNQILTNEKEKIRLTEEYEALLKAEDELNSEITKMQDPEYIAKYAREKYENTKNDEVIIKVED